jgi:LysM repeat protein
MSKFFRVLTPVLILIIGLLAAISPKANAAVAEPDYFNMPTVVATAITHQPVTYIVKSGDSLASIAIHYDTDWQSLYCGNKAKIGTNPNVISPGERLSIPSEKLTCHIVLPAVENVSPPTKSDPTTVTETVSYTPQESMTSLQEYALELLGGNGQQYSCLNSIINNESGWNIYAENPSSGAYGIPQALPGSKMSVAGSDWESDGETQLRWMVDDYVNPVYGSSCNAWTFHLAHGYY